MVPPLLNLNLKYYQQCKKRDISNIDHKSKKILIN